MGLGTRVGPVIEPPLSIPRILQYPNPPGAPTFYPERSENDLILGLLVSPGYFFITLVLLVGLALGDASEYGVSPHHCPFLKLFPSDVSLQHLWLPSPPECRRCWSCCCQRGRSEWSHSRFQNNIDFTHFQSSLTLCHFSSFESWHLTACTKNINS